MSPPASYQTVRLARGRHDSPDRGVCALELTSMLAGEGFTDRPGSACPALAAFLRGYNDALDEDRRQELRGLASALVGSRAASRETAGRAAECIAWARGRKRLGIFGPRMGYGDEMRRTESAGQHAGRIARRDGAFHAATLAFVEALAEGTASPPAPALAPAAARYRDREEPCRVG